MTVSGPIDISAQQSELVELTLDLLSVDTSNPPGDTREIVDQIEEWLDPLDIETERFAVDPAKPNLLVEILNW